MDRVILHCDCNSFFASVETALNPSYKDVPMAVCGRQEDRHGIVLAKNELAKAYNIKTAETVYSAKKKCPSLVIASPHYDMYAIYSKRVNDIYKQYTDLVEPFGIDESWLDVTASARMFGTGMQIAEQIRRRVREEVGITVSIGVSFNKAFAKLGSDYKKPDAITEISRENYKTIAYPLNVSDLLFVGKNTADALLRLGVRTIGDLASLSPQIVEDRLGKIGILVHNYACGIDDSLVCPTAHDEIKSISNGHTFRHNLLSNEECYAGILFLSEQIGTRLRERHLKATTVSIAIKDEFLSTVQKQRAIKTPTDISGEIADIAYDILRSFWQNGRPVRSLTVSVQGLVDAEFATEQISFFEGNKEESRNKSRKKEETMDKIRQKYGASSIVRGSTLKNE